MSEVRLIDANALKKSAYPFPCAIGVEYAVTIRAIDDAPTIDTVRHARWIERRVTDRHVQYICSGCNDYHGHRDCDIAEARAANEDYLYCRKCGARMDAEEKNNG